MCTCINLLIFSYLLFLVTLFLLKNKRAKQFHRVAMEMEKWKEVLPERFHFPNWLPEGLNQKIQGENEKIS